MWLALTAIAGARACIDYPPPPGDQSQVATKYRKRAFHYMRTHLRRLPLVIVARVGRTWGLYRPIDMVSTGPDRVHTILLRHPYKG